MDIVKALRQVGATVLRLSAEDAPDLLVGYRGQNWLVEVKRPGRFYSKGQTLFSLTWRGQIALVQTIDEALLVIGAI